MLNYIKPFAQYITEKVLDWRDSSIPELEQRVREIGQPIRAEEFAQLAGEYGVDVIDYDTFFDQLSPRNRAGAPARTAPIFGLYNPELNRAQIVTSMRMLPPAMLAHALHMIKHETIHSLQAAKRPAEVITGGWDVSDRRGYFSNRDEVMAWAHSVADSLISTGARSAREAILRLKSSPIWNMIESAKLDAKTRKKYIKYIYEYLVLELGE